MPTDDDYGRRERLLLHQHTATQFGPGSAPQSQSQSQPQLHSHSHSHSHLHTNAQSQNPGGTPSGVSAFEDHSSGRYTAAGKAAGVGSGVVHRYEKPPASDQLSTSDVYGGQNHVQERYSQHPGLQGYHQFSTSSSTVGRLDRFSLYGDQVGTDVRNPDQQRYQHAINLGDRFLPTGPKDDEHYATPGLLLSSELFPSPPSPAPTNDRFIPPPPLSPTPSEKYASSQSLSGYCQGASDHGLLPVSSPSPKDRFGTAPASPIPSAKDRSYASAERLLANASPVLQGTQGIYGSSGKDQTNRYSLSSERLLSASPIHAPVPERFAGSRGPDKLQSSPRHERYHHTQEGSRDRYSGSGSERYLSSSPNPEGAHQRYASTERVPAQDAQARRYSTSEQQRYGNGGSPACMDVQSSRCDRFDILAQRYGQRMDRFVSGEHLAPGSSSERLLASGSPSNSNGRYHGSNYTTNTSQTSPCNDNRYSSGSGSSSSALSPTPEAGINRYGNQKNGGEKYFTLSKSSQNYNTDRYQPTGQNSGQERSSRLDRFHAATNPTNSGSGSGSANDSRYSPGRSQTDKNYLSLPKPKDNRFPSTGRVVAPSSGCNSVGNDRAYQSAHTPVERYVPQPPPEILYPGYVDLYIPPSAHTPTDRYVPAADPGDPYMRRDLGFHHHYRLPPPGYPYHHQSQFRFRGFVYAPQNRLGGSPGSSSSTSSTTSAQREFSTSPLLRPKARVSNIEFSAQPRHGGPNPNHSQCCAEHAPQTQTAQRTCCPPARRSLPTCNTVTIANLPTQNNQPHTSW